jgi:hypothetical protein
MSVSNSSLQILDVPTRTIECDAKETPVLDLRGLMRIQLVETTTWQTDTKRHLNINIIILDDVCVPTPPTATNLLKNLAGSPI